MNVIKLPEQIFPVGFQYTCRSKNKVKTIVDHLYTYNSKTELVRFRYVVQYEFMGQKLTAFDVCHATIKRDSRHDQII